MIDRRVESRFLCADLVTVDWLAGENEARNQEAILEDISTLGACVQVEDRIPVGAAISISVKAARFTGNVSYCVFRDYGYFVGIRFSDGTPWSSRLFEPQHLTNLETLTHCALGHGD
jgi:hypothetical protein